MSETSEIFLNLDVLAVDSLPGKDTNYVFLRDGSVSKLIRIKGFNDRNMNELERTKFYEEFADTISELGDERVSVQFLYTRRSRVLKSEINPEGLPRESKERIKFFENLSKKGVIKENDIVFSINVAPRKKKQFILKEMQDTAKEIWSVITMKTNMELLNEKFKNLALTVAEVEREWKIIRSFLKVKKIEFNEIKKKQDIVDMYRERIALTRAVDNKNFELTGEESFRREIFQGIGAQKYADYFLMDGKLIKTFTLDSVESRREVLASAIDHLLDVPYDFTYSVNFTVVPFEKAQKEVVDSINATKTEGTSLKGETDELAQATLNKQRDVNRKLGEEGRKMARVSFNMAIIIDHAALIKRAEEDHTSVSEILYSIDKELHVKNFGAVAQSKWRSLFGQHLPLYMKMLPGASSANHIMLEGRLEFVKNVTWMCGLYNNTRDKVKHYGNNHFLNQDNTIYPYLHIDPTMPSFTTKIAGPMGTGKSVTMGVIESMSDYARELSGKPALVRKFIFEGASGSGFKRAQLDKAYSKAEHFTFDSSKKPYFSLFSLKERGARPKPSKVEKIISYLKENELYMDAERRIFLQAINDFYDKLSNFDGDITKEVRENFCHQIFKVNPLSVYEGKELVEHLTLKKGEMIPDEDNMSMILSNVSYMLSEQEGKGRLRQKYTLKNIKQIVMITYDRLDNEFPIVSDLVDTLNIIIKNESGDNTQNDQTLKILKEMKNDLFDWTIEGTLPYFDSREVADLDADKITYDLYGLSPEKNLRLFKIYLTVIAQKSIEDMYRDMSRTKLLIIDEDWYFKQVDESLCDIFYIIQKASRKYKFYVLSGSQQVMEDLKALKNQKEIMDGYRQFIICGMNAGDRDAFLNYFKDEFHPGVRQIIDQVGFREEEINGVTLKYQNMLIANKVSGEKWEFHLVKNIISPYELQINSSNEDENAIIKYLLFERKMNVEEAIDEIFEHYSDLRVDPELHEYLRVNNNFNTIEFLKKNKKL